MEFLDGFGALDESEIRIGIEASNDTGEPSLFGGDGEPLYPEPVRDCVQSFTYTFALEWRPPGEDNRLLDYLPDNYNRGPAESAFENALSNAIDESLSTLKEREAKILRLYFGLGGQEPMTLEQIGSVLGITRERVRQIKEKAISRLRHVSRSRALQSFFN